MIELDILPGVDTLMDRQKLVGWIVRDGIINAGMSYTQASRRWPMALPTLNRLMNTGNVGLRFYRQAEINLNLPRGLLEAVADGDTESITEMADLDEPLRTYILTELGVKKPLPRNSQRKAGGSR